MKDKGKVLLCFAFAIMTVAFCIAMVKLKKVEKEAQEKCDRYSQLLSEARVQAVDAKYQSEQILAQYTLLLENYNKIFDKNLRYSVTISEMKDELSAYEMVYGPLASDDSFVDESLRILEEDDERFVDTLAIYTSKNDPRPTPTPHP